MYTYINVALDIHDFSSLFTQLVCEGLLSVISGGLGLSYV